MRFWVRTKWLSFEMPGLEDLGKLSLALKTEKGVVIVTGCSHTKAEAIVRIAKQVVGRDVNLVADGYHFFPMTGGT